MRVTVAALGAAWAACAALAAGPDALAHTPEHLPGGFHSRDLGAGERWNWTFTAAGTVYYHCHQHPFMEATMDVTAADAAAAPNASVAIENYAFRPSSLRVAAGAAVEWANLDNDTHSVVQSRPPAPVAGRGGLLAAPAAAAVLVAVAALAAALRRPGG